MLVKRRKPWHRKDHEVTPEGLHLGRRRLLRGLGAGAAAAALGCGDSASPSATTFDGPPDGNDASPSPYQSYFPVPRNGAYDEPARGVTPASQALRFNNFYEYSIDRRLVWQVVGDLALAPWTVEVDGLVNNPGRFDVDDLFRHFAMEERVYRVRYVGGWSATVPWSGFPLRDLVRWVEPSSDATHVRFVSAYDPGSMPGTVSGSAEPWPEFHAQWSRSLEWPWSVPYTDGLRLDEAVNELTFLAAGSYGDALTRQGGAPLRLVVPWKYGYKSPKSIVRIEFVDREPSTFWPGLVPSEFGFHGNVLPDEPHPRWTQTHERILGNREWVRTERFNGYEEQVAHLYV